MKRTRGRGLIAVLGGTAVVVLATMTIRPGSDEPQDVAASTATAAAAGVGTPGRAMAAGAASPRLLPTPYAYRDAGREMFVLERPAATNSDMYPAPVHMNRAGAERAATAAPGGTMDVTLPDGTRFPVTFERAETGPGGNWTWIGRVQSPLGELAAVLTYGRDGVFGALPTPDGRLFQVQTSNGQAFVQLDPGLVPPGFDPQKPVSDVVMPPPVPRPPDPTALGNGSPMTPPAGSSVTMVPKADGTTVQIKVLGVYTTNLVQQRGSASAAETEFVNLLALSNQAQVDSATVARFEMVGMLETDYPADASNATILSALQTNTLADGLDIHAERDAAAADLVALLRPYAVGDSSCGIAYLNGGGLNSARPDPEYGYSVNNVNPCGIYTMPHELGHNLGSAHDIDNATSLGAYEFSYGYKQSEPTNFATVMAYPDPGQPQLGFYSAPANNQCLESACGVAGKADNVRSINLMAESISRFRDLPDTVSLFDAKTSESGSSPVMWFQVRLGSPAPAGGVQFDIATVEGGTATAGSDYIHRGETARTIPEGERMAWFWVNLVPDEVIEGDETVLVRISNVQGMAVFDEEATGLILDDDPHVTVSGSLVFPGAMVAPTIFASSADGYFKGAAIDTNVTFTGSDYAFSVPRGARVRLTVTPDPQSPWFALEAEFDDIGSDTKHDLVFERAAAITGRVLWPDGATQQASSILMFIEDALTGEILTSFFVEPPDFTYFHKARRGQSLSFRTNWVAAPYVDQRMELLVDGDMVEDMVLSTSPSLTIAKQPIEEGPAGTSRTINVEVKVSTSFRDTDVTFDLATETGTATDPSDYVGKSLPMTISRYNDSAWTTIVVNGDDLPERDEEFRIVAKNIYGAHMPSAGVIRILDDDEKPAPSDFDGDGKSDLVWRHSTLGRAALWGGAQYANVRNLLSVRDVDWRILGAGDFDRDRKADLLWRHRIHGRNTIWRSADHATQLSMAVLEGSGWEVAGVGDFDGDMQSDVLWHHAGNGSNMIWRGGDARASVPVTRITDTNWRIAGIGDVNGDGHSDIVWRHALAGANAIWLSGSHGTQQKVAGVTDVAWTLAGTGDFDGDRRDDLLWTHLETGASVIWFAGDRNDQKVLTRVTDRNWDIVRIGDYDGDGIADVVWRNEATGRNAIWLGGEYKNQLPVVGVRDTAWKIVN